MFFSLNAVSPTKLSENFFHFVSGALVVGSSLSHLESIATYAKCY